MPEERVFSSYAAEGEIAIGAEDLASLDEGERRRRTVEELRTAPDSEAIPGLMGSLGDSDWRVRRAAATALGGDAPADPSTQLVALLASEDAGERNAAIKALIKRGAESVPALLGTLESPDADVRNFTCVALGQIGDAAALPALLALVDGEPDPNVRYMAIEALGRLRDRRAVGRLVELLAEDVWFAATAAEALGQIGGPEALAALISRLAEDPVGLVAIDALGTIGDVRALLPLVKAAEDASAVLGVPIVGTIGRIIESVDPEVTAAAEHIRSLARERVSPGLVESVEASLEERGEVRARAMRVAAWLAESSLARAVFQAVDDPALVPLAVAYLTEDFAAVRPQLSAASVNSFPSVRMVALEAIAAAGDRSDLPLVLELLSDPNQGVCLAAVGALASIGGSGDAPHLVRLLSSPLEEIHMAAAETIGALGVAEVDGVLTELAEDEDPRVRQAVARTFARLDNTPCGHQQLCKAILSLARDPDSLVRAEIAPMFGKSDCVDSISALLVLSMDEFRDVRLAAIRTLAKRRDPAARRALRVATGDESRSIRAAAVRGLAGDPGDEDIALVLSLLLDGDPGTVISAIGALAESGSPGATHAIVRLFDHEAADVREAVLRALAAEDPSAARDLAAVVLSGVEPAWNVRLAAAQVLVGCDAGGRAVVERALRDPEPMVRAAAVAAVPGAFGDESGEILVTRLADADLREATRDALIAMGDSGGAAIAGALDVLTGPARRSATFALAAIGDQIGCEALRGLLSSADAEDRWLAVSALAANGCHGIDIASAATGEPDQTMRRIIERVAAAGAQR